MLQLDHTRRHTRGFALVAVLWSLATLALIASAVVTFGISSKVRATHERDRGRYDALAEAGSNIAILSLFDPSSNNRWPIDGSPRDLQFDGVNLRISIQAEYGKVDINAADGPTLAKLLKGTGLGDASADALADKIVDWRDANSLHQLNGAEAEDYAAVGFQYAPSNAPFERIEDLQLVMGMTATLFQAISSSITVYSHRPGINLALAPKPLLELLSVNRDQMNSNAISDGVINSAVGLTNWPFTVRVEVLAGQETQYAREMVIRLTNEPARPFLVHRSR